MPANVFDVFMGQHPPLAGLVDHANRVLWDETALAPVVKERTSGAIEPRNFITPPEGITVRGHSVAGIPTPSRLSRHSRLARRLLCLTGPASESRGEVCLTWFRSS